MKKTILAVSMMALTLATATAPRVSLAGERLSVRATALSADVLKKLEDGELSEITVEFRHGDRLPVALQAQGDLLESVDGGKPVTVAVKRGFFIRMTQDDLLLSFDGKNFEPIQKRLTGSLTVSAGTDQNGGAAQAINLLFTARVKE